MDFTYPPLSGHSIRVLDVSIEGEHSEPVCTFGIVSLDDPPSYTAISYCWGDSTEVARIKFHDGQSLPLSRTLLDLFKSLKKESSHLSLWIDAICINQENTAEKELQIPLMGRVYSCATKVFVWLGESDSVTKNAFRFMKGGQPDSETRTKSVQRSNSFYTMVQTLYRKASSIAQHETETSEYGLRSMFLLLQRPWFQRVWVIQEIAVGRNIQVGCGDDRVDFDLFSDGVFSIWNSFTGLGRYQDDHPAVLGFWCVTRMIDIREDYQEKLKNKESGVCYETLLEAALHFQATKACDKVFAFHGIADNRPVPKANYRISQEQVFIETAEALLCNGASLDLLALCGMGPMGQQPSVPTWVPDLGGHSYEEPLVLCNSAGWNAGGLLEVPPKVVTEPSRRLRLQIKPIDEVDIVCPQFASWNVEEQRVAVEAVLSLKPRLSGDISGEAWMNRLAEVLILGLDIDDHPLRIGMPGWQEYRVYFDEWLDWVRSSTRQKDLLKIEANKYHRTVRPRIDTMKAFATRQGFLCIGPEAIEKGDVVCKVPGCRAPLVLRPDPMITGHDMKPHSLKVWRLVSWCYVDGLMFGGAAELEQPFTEVLLR